MLRTRQAYHCQLMHRRQPDCDNLTHHSCGGPWGYEFRPERFSPKGGRSLTRSDNWRPFGGGTTMCPGRYVRKRFVMLFVTSLLRRFDVGLVDKRVP
ncbi:hypothetical protein ASPBRDRAFT_417343 [Aspergillus brasiliensis CBS 101740]|uniref:Cytochrome P450 n=1 Tax=Aspergillus brasiliensis (strain CBS 101740 / IMI 381727 / IBT 21946) TaxID=767769 RepID=A0A1L9UYF6_ASPBC|nr:hypothetical protein ASPBRDRAFT_417343 [Aspergillus brasiliensis CBS 101740]